MSPIPSWFEKYHSFSPPDFKPKDVTFLFDKLVSHLTDFAVPDSLTPSARRDLVMSTVQAQGWLKPTIEDLLVQIRQLTTRVCQLEDANTIMKEQLAQQVPTKSFRDVVAAQQAVHEEVQALRQKVTSTSPDRDITEIVNQEQNKSKLVIFNLPETNSLEETVTQAFALIGQKPRFQASRLGKPGSKPRPVLVTLSDQVLRTNILKSCGKLKGQTTFPGLFLGPSLTRHQQHLKKLAWPAFQDAKKAGKKVFFREEVLFVDGSPVSVSLPPPTPTSTSPP